MYTTTSGSSGIAPPKMAQVARLRYPPGERDLAHLWSTLLIAAILLAGGLSRRMGRPKLLLDLRGQPVIRRTVEALLGRLDDVVVVTGTEDAALREALAGLDVRFANNPRPQNGQGSSIAVGVRALKPWTRAVLIVLGDQPRLPDPVVPTLIESFERIGKPIVTPVYRGVQGNPVLFGNEMFAELAALTGDAGGKAVLGAHPDGVARIAFDLPMPADLDTPEDYARLHVE
jgi:molybdenum cofactor cytidylyltransferase